jgi:hypothetical protein
MINIVIGSLVFALILLVNVLVFTRAENANSKLEQTKRRLKELEREMEKEIDAIEIEKERELERERERLREERRIRIKLENENQRETGEIVGEPIRINIRTRGEAGKYQQVGVLSSANVSVASEDGDTNTRILPLFGRETYPGSNKWNYYTSTDGYHLVSLPVMYKNKDCMEEYGCDEIYDGDTVFIKQYNSNYTVDMYNNGSLRYLPSVL